jgi:Uma2 family endonuclease
VDSDLGLTPPGYNLSPLRGFRQGRHRRGQELVVRSNKKAQSQRSKTVSTIEPGEPMTSWADPSWIPSPLYRLNLDQYEAMVNSGVFSGRERFHLINGLLVAKMTQNDLHSTADELCGNALDRAISAGWHVRAAKPIRIPSQASKPEPDRCITRGSIRDYLHRSPEPADIALVVEISDTSLSEDRKLAAIYAAAEIPSYWIVNHGDRQVEVYTNPGLSGYQSRHDYQAGETIPINIDGKPIGPVAVSDLLP